MNLNQSAYKRISGLVRDPARYSASISKLDNGTTIVDCGAKVRGGLDAGVVVAEACLAGLGCVAITNGSCGDWSGPFVEVTTSQPVAACMAAQYAGWSVASEKYFAMGSGPMRSAYAGEEIFGHLQLAREQAEQVVGVLETDDLPPADVCTDIAQKCNVSPDQLTLLIVRTASVAGAVQVVARSVETALHKMHELKFDLHRVVSGFGAAPLPPVAKNDIAGIGRTNDAILYGGEVSLWVTGDDESVEAIGEQTPSSSSKDFGRPFIEIFKNFDNDFYKIDPLLFSPAAITLINIDTGNSFRFGQTRSDILQQSFANS